MCPSYRIPHRIPRLLPLRYCRFLPQASSDRRKSSGARCSPISHIMATQPAVMSVANRGIAIHGYFDNVLDGCREKFLRMGVLVIRPNPYVAPGLN